MLLACCAMLVSSSVGCWRAGDLQFVASTGISELEPSEQEAIRQALQKWSGTPRNPKMMDATSPESEELKYGALVYERNCMQCHGISGDGNGQAAQYLTPNPRDYRRGIFKFVSAPYGYKPSREDLVRTVTRGIPGTSMPSFRRLPKRDLDAVVDYVLALTHRGELETRLLGLVQSGDELNDDAIAEAANDIREQWKMADDQAIEPLTKMPPITPETIATGAAVFQKRECFKCHGRDGRGGLAGGIEVGKDVWGRTDPAADLTSGMLRGGQRPLDVYRRVYGGINGSPMPAFKEALSAEPDTIWHLAHYVLHLADQRRRGKQFEPDAPKAVSTVETPVAAGSPADAPPTSSSQEEPK
jgi:mono/diheme cytochrome c family protein